MSQLSELEIYVGAEVYHMNTHTRDLKQQYSLEFHNKTQILEGREALDTICTNAAQWIRHLGMTRVAFLTQVMVEELELKDSDPDYITIVIYATARD